MKIVDIILELDDLPDEAIVFASRINGHFAAESPAVILSLSESELGMKTADIAALKAPGTEYFLEANLIRDMVCEWSSSKTADSDDASQLIDQIIHYAEFDA